MGASAVSGALGGIGIIGAGASASAQQRSINNYASQMERLASQQLSANKALTAPYLQAAGFAMPKLQGLTSMYASKAGKSDPTINQSLSDSLTAIGRNAAQETARAGMVFGSTGNKGAEYGAGLRADRAATDQTNSARLGAARAQLAYKENNLASYAGSLGNMAQLGQVGTNAALNSNNQYYQNMQGAAQMRANGAMDNYSDLGGIFGQIASQGLNGWQANQQQSAGIVANGIAPVAPNKRLRNVWTSPY